MKKVTLACCFLGIALFLSFSCKGPEKKDSGNMPSDSLKTAVAKSLDDYVLLVKDGLADTAKTIEILKTYLDANPAVFGSAIAFAPTIQGTDTTRISLYTYRNDTGYDTKNFGKLYDYTKDPWYSVPVSQKKAVWSEPYFDAPGGNVQMITYSVPFLNAGGAVLGVITADLEIKQAKE